MNWDYRYIIHGMTKCSTCIFDALSPHEKRFVHKMSRENKIPKDDDDKKKKEALIFTLIISISISNILKFN